MSIKKIEIDVSIVTIHPKMNPKYDEDDYGSADDTGDFRNPQLVELE